MATILAHYRKLRGVSLRELGQIGGGVSTQSAQRWCLDPGDSNYRRPGAVAAEAIRLWSNGLVNFTNHALPFTPEVEAEWQASGHYPKPDEPAAKPHVRAAEDVQ